MRMRVKQADAQTLKCGRPFVRTLVGPRRQRVTRRMRCRRAGGCREELISCGFRLQP